MAQTVSESDMQRQSKAEMIWDGCNQMKTIQQNLSIQSDT
jgi:hypothetical protein